MQNYVSFIAVQAIYSRGKHMTEMTKTDIQRVALKEAEDELCALATCWSTRDGIPLRSH